MIKFTNIAEALDLQASKEPEKIALYYPLGIKRGKWIYSHYTFNELKIKSDFIAKGLLEYGFKSGDHVALMVTPSLEFFALSFALFKAKLVPILIDPGIGIKNLKTCLAEAKPVGFIGIPKAHIARIILKWGRDTIKRFVTVACPFPLWGSTLEQIEKLGKGSQIKLTKTDPQENAAIIFTSGSTGIPKGVIYQHKNFIAQVKFLHEQYQMQPNELDMPTFPLFALFNPAFGVTSVIPKMNFTKPGFVNPRNIIEPIQQLGISSMFASPALLSRVGRYADAKNIKLPSIKRILSAGAPANPKTLNLFKNILRPGICVHTPYGATEALPISSIQSDYVINYSQKLTAQGDGVCVGKLFHGIEVKIIRIIDEPIESWDDQIEQAAHLPGEIIVRGPNVTHAYFNRPSANSMSKIKDGDTFWHRMGDIGYFDPSENLWFLGRKAHRVELEGVTLFSVSVEGVYNTHPLVSRSALVGVLIKEKMTPVVCIELELGEVELDRIKHELLELGQGFEHTKDITNIIFHPSFPVDIRHNAKIFREKLAVWAKDKVQ